MANSTKQKIMAEIAKALDPLKNALASTNSFQAFMLELGWDIGTIPTQIGLLLPKVNQLYSDMGPVLSNTATSTDYANISLDIKDIATSIKGLSSVNFSQYVTLGPTFASKFPEQLINYLIYKYFDGQ